MSDWGRIQGFSTNGDNECISTKSEVEDRVTDDGIFQSHQWRISCSYSDIAGAAGSSGSDSCAKQSTAQYQGWRATGHCRDIVECDEDCGRAGTAVERRGRIRPSDRGVTWHFGPSRQQLSELIGKVDRDGEEPARALFSA